MASPGRDSMGDAIRHDTGDEKGEVNDNNVLNSSVIISLLNWLLML